MYEMFANKKLIKNPFLIWCCSYNLGLRYCNDWVYFLYNIDITNSNNTPSADMAVVKILIKVNVYITVHYLVPYNHLQSKWYSLHPANDCFEPDTVRNRSFLMYSQYVCTMTRESLTSPPSKFYKYLQALSTYSRMG